MTLVPLPNNGAKSLPWTESLNFPSLNNLFKFSAQGRDLAPFFGNGLKVKIPSEIKPPLYSTDISSPQLFFGSHSWIIRCSAVFLTKNYLQETTTSKQKNIKKRYLSKWLYNTESFKNVSKFLTRKAAETFLEKNLIWLKNFKNYIIRAKKHAITNWWSKDYDRITFFSEETV